MEQTEISMKKKRGLGRGLNALLAGSKSNEIQETSDTHTRLQNLPIEFLQPGRYQPRQDMDQEALEELASSIRSQGIIQPIIVRPVSEHRYEIIAGERRWRAAQLAELDTVPALIRDIPDESAIEMALIENIQRENLNPIEEANALSRLMSEFEMTQERAADVVGKSRSTVTNILRLLALNLEVKTMVEHGDLDMGHAKALLGLSGELQNEAARQVVAKDLSVRETELLVKRFQQPKESYSVSTPKHDPNIHALQTNLSEKLGAKIAFQHHPKGKGKLIIHYNSLDELEGILNHID